MTEEITELSDENILDHPTRLKLYLFMRKKKKPVGIRETQRALDIASPSTVSWHFEKLVDANLLLKTPNNLYSIDPDSPVADNLSVQISFTLRIFRERLVSPLTFILYFLLSMIILTVIVWVGSRNPLFIGLQGILSLMVSTIVVLYFWRQVHNEIRKLE